MEDMRKKFRLIALLNSYTQGISGGDARFIEIAKRLNEKNLKIYVITSRLGKMLCERRGLRTKYLLTTAEGAIKNIILTYLWRIFRALRLNLKLEDGDILYSTSDFLPDTLPAFIWKLKNDKVRWVQVIHHLYGNPLKRRGKNFLVNLLGYLSQRFSFILIKNKADAILVYGSREGERVKKYFMRMGFRSDRIYEVQNGVDCRIIRGVAGQEKIYDACFVGRLAESKGVFDLLIIWKLVCERKKDATLVIIGDGQESVKEKLKRRISELGLEKNVILAGLLEGEDLYRKISMCKIGVHPSYEEGWGTAICEIMACGLPVVAWDLPVYENIYPKGILKAPLKNVTIFSKHILELLGGEQLYYKTSQDAQEVALKYDWDKIAINEMKILEEISEEWKKVNLLEAGKLRRGISIKGAHEDYIDRWLNLYEFDRYKKWLFRKVVIPIMRKYIPKGYVAEIGCSKGYLVRELTSEGYEVVGIDISRRALLYARRILKPTPSNIIRADGENIPLKKESVHAVLFIHTLEHLPNPEIAISQAFNILKPGGLFLAITPNKNSVLRKIVKHFVRYTALDNPYHVSLMGRGDLINLLIKANFNAIKIYYFHNGFLGFLKKLGDYIPLPYQISVPGLHHFIVIAIKERNIDAR